MFNSLNNQQLFTPFVDDDNNPLCFNWQQSSNEDRKFLLNLMKSIICPALSRSVWTKNLQVIRMSAGKPQVT